MATIISRICQNSLIALIQAYRYIFSHWLGRCCRFEPSCSLYAMEVIKQYGCFKGCYLSVKRLLKCQPWHPGGTDPVP